MLQKIWNQSILAIGIPFLAHELPARRMRSGLFCMQPPPNTGLLGLSAIPADSADTLPALSVLPDS